MVRQMFICDCRKDIRKYNEVTLEKLVLDRSIVIKLVNPSFAVETWPSDIEAKYNKVLNWYNNLSAANKASFDTNNMNNPLNGYTMVDKRGYF